MHRSIALASVSFLAVGLMAACSSGGDEMVGGMTECTDAIINAEAEKYVTQLGAENAWYPDTVQCADGWAVASGVIGLADPPADGPMGAPANVIFQQEGQFWIPKEAPDVCGTFDDGNYPSDAEIPQALYTACTSG
jgi:hypothetical protein